MHHSSAPLFGLDKYMSTISELCKKYKVRNLALFGSVLTERFNEHSDIDMLVNFDTTNHEEWDYVTNFFDFQEALEQLLGRKVDLVVEKAMKNKYFIKSVNQSKQIIYG